MAQFERSPWELDDGDTNILYRGGPQDGPYCVQLFRFVNYDSSDDYCIVRDRSGKIVWEAKGQQDQDPIETIFAVPEWFWGLQVDISKGKLYLHIV